MNFNIHFYSFLSLIFEKKILNHKIKSGRIRIQRKKNGSDRIQIRNTGYTYLICVILRDQVKYPEKRLFCEGSEFLQKWGGGVQNSRMQNSPFIALGL